jgi:hypothetical protein
MLEPNSKLLKTARIAAAAAQAPVVGGVAVFLHGYRRTTEDVDLFADDASRVRECLRDAGANWNSRRREFTLGGVPIHLVTVEETGSEPGRISVIQGVPVVGLADLIRFKLHSGLQDLNRAKDLADVVELIRRVPLTRAFAAKLPAKQRAAFKRIVDSVKGSGSR